MRIDLITTESRVMNGLKDFQKATVNRVLELFESGQNRVLVADEVGLGKTLIARGVIARTAKLHEDLQDDLFKVIYICSNQNIANQNIKKLKISKEVTVDGVTDTRLSMQHLKIFEQEFDQNIRDNYIQLIPLTPGTSFSMTSGTGRKEERALMFAVLKRIDRFQQYEAEMDRIFASYATTGWPWKRDEYEGRVVACNEKSDGKYCTEITRSIEVLILEQNLDIELVEICQKIQSGVPWHCSQANGLLGKLRMIFAQVSIDLLKPDLVIMDEFQRFRSLIAADVKSETGMLAERFLKNTQTKVLLLSATPFKLYSTLEEMKDTESDEHYYEFYQVMDFLFGDEGKRKSFKETWSNYSIQLREGHFDKGAIIQVKHLAEETMYAGVSRTERNAVSGSEDIIDASGVSSPLRVTSKDIMSYMEAEKIVSEVARIGAVPVDYVKSAPYILSFMKEYKLKKKLHKFFVENPEEIKLANKKHLWINDQAIKKYAPLEITNARLGKLNETAFQNQSELLLWIPPSMPYYEPHGVYKKAGNYSKTLVFSAWEMVPRMIATLVSYDTERRTVGRLLQQNKDSQKINYSMRNPQPRLKFNVVDEEPQAMTMFCLLYPSKFLAETYNPVVFLNQKSRLIDIENELKGHIQNKLSALMKLEGDRISEDRRWYYLAPVLLDAEEYAMNWLNNIGEELFNKETESDERGSKGILAHVTKLREYYNQYQNGDLQLGRMPTDLLDVLTDQAISSPAVCAFRTNGGDGLYATLYAKTITNLLNRPESIAAIDLSVGKTSDEVYWRNVLTYCKNGNFQSMLDEFAHILIESNGLSEASNRSEALQILMLDSMQTHSANYLIDTFSSFKRSVTEKKEKGMAIRSHFAVAFQNGKSDQKQDIRKENIRNAFNSPFRPFVLATTSIGQEGLDFHYYCRKIMHWNLPSNPVDLEQREGRINRFKCHAIRQNLAQLYGSQIDIKSDFWRELFDYAKLMSGLGQSDLVPYWCLPDQQSSGHIPIKIERIVPQYPMSKDIVQYHRLIQILSLYRLSLGQPRQEELIEQLIDVCNDQEELKDFFINLSPFFRNKPVENLVSKT